MQYSISSQDKIRYYCTRNIGVKVCLILLLGTFLSTENSVFHFWEFPVITGTAFSRISGKRKPYEVYSLFKHLSARIYGLFDFPPECPEFFYGGMVRILETLLFLKFPKTFQEIFVMGLSKYNFIAVVLFIHSCYCCALIHASKKYIKKKCNKQHQELIM